MDELLRKTLLRHERVLWLGQPKKTALFTREDMLLIPFSCLWGGFAIYWELTLLWGRDESGQGAPMFFIIMALPFAVFGFYTILGRFIYKLWAKKNTYYAITNKRIIVINKTKASLQATDIRSIPSIGKTISSNGIGTVKFGKSRIKPVLENTGMDFLDPFIDNNVLTFYDIPDVSKVYKIVNKLKRRHC
jgi:hypothetical protein